MHAIAVAARISVSDVEPNSKGAQSSATQAGDDAPSNSPLYWAVVERRGEDGVKDIDFQVLSAGCPSDQQVLKNRIERTLSTLRLVYPGTDSQKGSVR